MFAYHKGCPPCGRGGASLRRRRMSLRGMLIFRLQPERSVQQVPIVIGVEVRQDRVRSLESDRQHIDGAVVGPFGAALRTRWSAKILMAITLPPPEPVLAEGMADWFLTLDQQGQLAY